MTRSMLVTVSVGLTPVQLGLGHPASAPDTVDGAVRTAGFVLNVRLPFLMASLGISVGAVTGPTRTLFCPGATLPPWFWHWYTAKPLTVVLISRLSLPSPASVPVHVTDAVAVPDVMVQTGSPPFLK